MSATSRDRILDKLRAARRPFPDAPPRPARYLPVTSQPDTSVNALIDRFAVELTALKGEPFIVEGDAAARERILNLMENHGARRVIAWELAHIPVAGLGDALAEAGIEVLHPHTHDSFRAEMLSAAEAAQVSLTGADAAAATTGTLIFTTQPGRGRIPTVLAPVHIAVITADQLVTRVEDWVATLRADGMRAIRQRANFCFVTGPSRTGDIEMELILGVHGPGRVQVVIKR
jgi:L-lactate dehydrogenase complex protein LldG